jgi:hypothetical protein
MSELRAKFETRLKDLPGVTIDHWKDTDLVCLFYNGKEFAHFHGDNILDIRLSQKIIRQQRLTRSVSNQIHPNRSQNSRWIGFELENDEDVQTLLELVQLSCDELG